MNWINSENSEFYFEENQFCPPYPICVDSPGNQETTLVDYYQDYDGDDLPNVDEPCAEQYCAEYSPPTGECSGGDDNEEDMADPDDNCFSNIIDECGVCEGDGYVDECENGSCENMDCLGNCGGDALVDCAGICEGIAFLDDCQVCSGGLSGHPENSDKDQYCGSCFGGNECIPQLDYYEPGGELINIRTDNIRFHFSVPIDYVDGGIEIESYDGSDIDFSINQSTVDSIIELTLDNPLISRDQMTIILDPCNILSIDSLNSIGVPFCLDTNTDFIPEYYNELDKEIIINVALMGDYDFDNQVDETDLDTLLSFWETDNYSYELGPFQGNAPYLQPLYSDFNQDYNIEDLMAFVQMWNWDYNNSLAREMELAPNVDYVPQYHFDRNHFSLDLSQFPGEIKRIWLKLNLQNNNLEIENTASSSEFDINLYGYKENIFIYDWVMGAISPLSNKHINLFNIISYVSNDQHIKLQYEIVGFNNEISSGEMDMIYHPLPENFTIDHPYPNPFNPITVINYGLPKPSNISINIFDVKGRVIYENNNNLDAGYYSFYWNASAYSSGIYFIQFQISDLVKTYRVLLFK